MEGIIGSIITAGIIWGCVKGGMYLEKTKVGKRTNGRK